MALEDIESSGKLISDMDRSNPVGSVDKGSSLDNHLRGIKNCILNTFKYITGPLLRTHTEINDMVPVGLICAWSGPQQNIPAGWKLCDGTNGTPDLREKFILGSGFPYNVGGTGGGSTVSTTSAGLHAHGGQVNPVALTESQMPSHTHLVKDGSGGDATGSVLGSGGNSPNFSGQDVATGFVSAAASAQLLQSSGGGQVHSHGVFNDGAHTHSVTVYPNYYRLAWIMRGPYTYSS